MKKLPLVIKLVLCIIFPPFAILWIISVLLGGFGNIGDPLSNTNEMVKCLVDMSNNPCNETVNTYLTTRERVKVTIGTALSDYEKNWPIIWEKVNCSNKVTTELKTKLRDHLMYSGKLYLADPEVIDNYEEA
ncbi:MAG: hypothetical protein II997_00645 [Clostridia bacterium]|nr:hypothetical protein [Clostridia bacterium]